MKPATPSSGSLFDADQFRMRRLQVFNWGTFSDLHDIPVAERGFLFVGPGGHRQDNLVGCHVGIAGANEMGRFQRGCARSVPHRAGSQPGWLPETLLRLADG
jgi:uncharacterized protein YPO0396